MIPCKNCGVEIAAWEPLCEVCWQHACPICGVCGCDYVLVSRDHLEQIKFLLLSFELIVDDTEVIDIIKKLRKELPS
jgi:hypothetical protein